MGPSWKDVKHVRLLDPREEAEQKKWDEEFKKRQKDLQIQRRKAEDRRYTLSLSLPLSLSLSVCVCVYMCIFLQG